MDQNERGDDDEDNPSDLSDAYSRISGKLQDFPALRKSLRGFSRAFPMPEPASIIPVVPSIDHQALVDAMQDFEPDSAPRETAENTRRVAEAITELHTVTQDLVALTASNLAITEEQRAAASRSERFAKRMTWGSLAVAVASLGAAIAALAIR